MSWWTIKHLRHLLHDYESLSLHRASRRDNACEYGQNEHRIQAMLVRLWQPGTRPPPMPHSKGKKRKRTACFAASRTDVRPSFIFFEDRAHVEAPAGNVVRVKGG
jgi:hypothetical protein